MRQRMLKSRIYRATVTRADLHYAGSITLDSRLMDHAGTCEFEQIQVLDITNGSRLETCAITDGPGAVRYTEVGAIPTS